jgi:hypothetical protein
LERLRAERATAHAQLSAGAGRFVLKQRQAQMAARHALQRIAAAAFGVPGGSQCTVGTTAADARIFAAAVHAAELQLPESWLPFVAAQ